MRFQVPQFVDIKDKVIGPLTLRQFAYYLVVILFLVVLYTVVDLGLLITLAIPLLGGAALFAHGRFYGQSFGLILSNAIFFYIGERTMLWQRGKKVTALHIYGAEYEDFTALDEATPSSLNVMAQELNTEGNVLSEDAADPLLEEDLGGPGETPAANGSTGQGGEVPGDSEETQE